MDQTLDTANKYFVSAQGDTLVILRPPSRLSKADALLLAAWLVAMAEDQEGEFAAVLAAVQNT